MTAISNNGGKLTVVAIEYSIDMENAVIFAKNEKVIDSKGNKREDDFVKLNTYKFYDEAGNEISAMITNIYINDKAEVKTGAVRGSGTGKYVIVELDTASTAKSVSVKQVAAIRTDDAIANITIKAIN